MAEYIVMPKLGLTMKEGTIRDWQKKEGDKIAMGELIFEIETDKITKKFESANAGTLLKILVPEGTVKVQDPVAIIGEEGEDYRALLSKGGALQEEKAEAQVQTQAKVAPKPAGGKVKISPRAKKRAQELGIDFSGIVGTGPGGAISVEDVEEAAKAPKATPMARITAEELGVDLRDIQADGRIRREDVLASVRGVPEEKEERIPMNRMRQIIAERMKESQNVAAPVNFTVTCDMTEVIKLRESLKAIKKVSYNDILVMITARTLKQHRLLNARVEEQEIVLHPHVHMGVAVAVENGLMVPVIRNACSLTLSEIADETARLAEGCRDMSINPDDLEGSTFSVTNLGMFGMESFTPIINQPNMAILGINAIRKIPVVVDDEVVVRPVMSLSLTADHRIVDGAVAAKFLQDLKARIEQPALLFL